MTLKTMRHQFFTHITLIGLLSPLLSCSWIPDISSSTVASSIGEPIVLTDVDFDPESLIPETQPVADYLGANLADVGIDKGEVQIAPDTDTAKEWIASGETDLYFDSVYPILKLMEETGATPILRRWKDGVPEYNTLFVTRRDSGLTQLEDLQEKMIALQNPDSSSGFMFPIVYMLEAGMNPVEKAEPNHPVAASEVGYVFSGRDETTVEWILNGKVAAGAIDSETFKEVSEADRQQLVVLAETDMYPRHIVLAGPGLTPEQIEAVKTVLIGMDESSEGQAALAEFSDTAQFDEFPEGAETAIDNLRTAYALFQTHLQGESGQP